MTGASRATAVVLALLAAATFPAAVHAFEQQDGAVSAVVANPIRKVVNMLQAMQKKVSEEAEKEEELYEKFVCWCKSGSGELSASIAEAETKMPQVGSNIKAMEEQKVTTEADLATAQDDRAGAKTNIEEATAIREKEAAAFAGVKAEAEANIGALAKAVATLEKGMAGGFLQTSAAKILRKLALSREEINSDDRQTLLAFLSAGDSASSGYAPQSGSVVGILKQLKDEMSKNFADADASEKAAIQEHEALMAAKQKEIGALTASIETKTKRSGELGVEIAMAKNDLSDTEEAHLENKKFLENLDKTCADKKADWEVRTKTRAEELAAIAEAIKVLNDDDALELFKKTVPGSSSFVQFGTKSSEAVRADARKVIQALLKRVDKHDRAQLDLIALALRGKGIGFEKVLAMIDKMVATLKQEQVDDDSKQEYCVTSIDSAEDKQKSLERKVSDHEAGIAEANEGIATLKEDIAALEAGVKALDESVAEATTQRKNENEAFTELMAENSAAKRLIEYAKNILHKFYNPKLYKAPEPQKLTEEEQIAVNLGGTPPPTEAPGGIAGTGIAVLAEVSAHSQRVVAKRAASMVPPPPETFGAYTKKGEETSGVMAMMDLLVKDLEKEMTEAETSEKDAQGDYETMMADSAEKRRADVATVATKQGETAKLDEALQMHTEGKAGSGRELAAVVEYMSQLHIECDWLLKYHEQRKEARTSEIESLGRAKAVLSGADFSLMQKAATLRQSSSGSLRGRVA